MTLDVSQHAGIRREQPSLPNHDDIIILQVLDVVLKHLPNDHVRLFADLLVELGVGRGRWSLSSRARLPPPGAAHCGRRAARSQDEDVDMVCRWPPA